MKVNPRISGKKPPVKPKSNKKKLFFIFLGSFIGFFFLCTFIATMLTPSIDVPALKNDPNLDSLTSEDFKGRIDPRLKSIELQEDAAPLSPDKADNPFAPKDSTDLETSLDDANINSDETQDNSEDTDDEIPYNSNDSKTNEDSGSWIKTPNQRTPQPQTTTEKQESKSNQNNLMLRDKIKVEQSPISMSKVMVGSYISPNEAKRISEELMKSNLNVTPFIKEENGVYSLQVGSFSNPSKAEVLVNELRKRNMPVKVVRE
jgi:cell division septation protein DedD